MQQQIGRIQFLTKARNVVHARFFRPIRNLSNVCEAFSLFKLTWLALGVDHAEPSRGGEQATALGRL